MSGGKEELRSVQHQRVQIERDLCELAAAVPPDHKINVIPLGKNYCPLTWDGLMCWPETPPGTTARLPCAPYIDVFDKNETASRECTINGTWFIKEATNQSWTDYTRCHPNDYPVNPQIDEHLHHIKLISKIGYSVSLLTLIIAFLILFCNKRLQCPRNHLHLQLFLSFISRSLLTHVKDVFFTLEDTNTLSCKLIIVVWQYSLLANYNWLLMEGLYLHNLVFFNIFNDNSSIMKYIVLGWSLPVLFIIPWIIARTLYEDTLCWVINENVALFWIIRGPITISIILNLIFFINITRVLFLKMFSSSSVAQASRCYKYSKWFKSTLVLVPLFGVHYALLLIANWFASISHTIEIIWLYVDLLFTSFQGFFVALLYCFLNGEVQQEMKKWWLRQASQQDHGLHSSNSMTYNSILTQSMSYLNRGNRNDWTTSNATLSTSHQCQSHNGPSSGSGSIGNIVNNNHINNNGQPGSRKGSTRGTTVLINLSKDESQLNGPSPGDGSGTFAGHVSPSSSLDHSNGNYQSSSSFSFNVKSTSFGTLMRPDSTEKCLQVIPANGVNDGSNESIL